jgi:hypothetical protein
MIPDPENGETSSKSNPARRFLSPFTEDRIRSGQVWLAPHLSLSLQKIEYVSENCEQAPIFFRLSLSLQKTGGCSEILENKFSRFRRAFTIFAPETKTIQTYGVQFQRDRSQVAAPLAGRGNLSRGSRSHTSQILRARHVPLPFGCGSARRTPAGLYRFGHLLALQTALRLQRTSSDGLRRFRPACRTVRHSDGAAPCRNDRTEHRPLPGTARQDRLLVRLAP